MTNSLLKSCIYQGVVTHTRLKPTLHSFNYKVFMMYLDLEELETVFKKSWLWSLNTKNLASFYHSDYLENNDKPLSSQIRTLVESKTGNRPDGAIRVLTNLRYFGFIINPISCYYCFDKNDKLEYVVAEVTNTPWKEKITYVIPCNQNTGQANTEFEKEMHVSPFMPMNIHYSWKSNFPENSLKIYMENKKNKEAIFKASLCLVKKEISGLSLNLILIKFPLMTLKVLIGIYWHAFRLWLKKLTIFTNPTSERTKKIEGAER